MAQPDWLRNEVLSAYLEYVDNTEPPILMHMWAAITCAAASLGRHVWLPFGIGDIYPNMYTLLVGPPGTRKSKAISFASELVQLGTKVRFAPDDTGGQRQGLISALEGDEDDRIAAKDERILEAADALSPEEALSKLAETKIRDADNDRNTMFVCSSEWGSFIGEGNTQLIRFLIKMWDGEDYVYKLKTERRTLRNACLTMVGGTTPTEIATLLPVEAQGQGFMSRIVLVHASRKRHKVPRPYLKHDIKAWLIGAYQRLSYDLQGPMKEDASAAGLLDDIYNTDIRIEDTRFVYYSERRHTHLQKLCMILASLRGDRVIYPQDVDEAQRILQATEKHMSDALGEYGLSPVATARQRLLEFVQQAGQPVPESLLWRVMQKDMKTLDFQQVLAELTQAQKLYKVTSALGPCYVWNEYAQPQRDAPEDNVVNLLGE